MERTRVKGHKGAVRRQDESYLLALNCVTTGHAFNWDRVPVLVKGYTKHTNDFIEAWNTSLTCVNQCYHQLMLQFQTPTLPSPIIHVSIVLISLSPTLSTILILTYPIQRTSLHRHLTKCRCYRCWDFLVYCVSDFISLNVACLTRYGHSNNDYH